MFVYAWRDILRYMIKSTVKVICVIKKYILECHYTC